MSARRDLYRAASLLGWWQAAMRGRLLERAWNVLVARGVNRATRRWYR